MECVSVDMVKKLAIPKEKIWPIPEERAIQIVS